MSHVLVIQHPQLPQLSLPATERRFALSQHCQATFARIPVPADTQLDDEVRRELQAACTDFAVLPDLAFGHDVRLIVSDMDSTLITIECIDEIAAQAGLKAQVAEITERAMRGELDFEQSLRRRVALLEGIPESSLHAVYADTLKLTDGAEYLLQECHKHQVPFVLVSGGFTFFTDRLKTRLGFEHAFANELEVEGGKLTGRVLGRVIDAQAKAEILAQFAAQYGGRSVAVGDGANDIPMLQAADFGIAFHAKPKTQAHADLCINHNGLAALRRWFA